MALSFLKERNELKGCKNEGSTGAVKSWNTGQEVKMNVVHSRIFYGYQKSSFLFPGQGFRQMLKLRGPEVIYKLPFEVLHTGVLLPSSIANKEMLASQKCQSGKKPLEPLSVLFPVDLGEVLQGGWFGKWPLTNLSDGNCDSFHY